MVVAGQFIHVSHDGQRRHARPAPGARPPMPPQMEFEQGGLLISGSTVDVSHANGSTIVAPELVRVSHANQSTFFNSPNREIQNAGESKFLESAKLPAGGPPPHPLRRAVEVKSIVPSRAVIFTHGGKRYVAEMNKEIVDESGQPVPELAGWTVSFADEGYVLFTNGGVDVGLIVPPAQAD
jgi:hypothetical protein